MSKTFELYTCTYKGDIVYVGSGIKGRHKHCDSGCSHVFELNEVFFLEGAEFLEVRVVYESRLKSDVEGKEVEIIKSRQPRFNKVHNGNTERQIKAHESNKLRMFLKNKGLESLKGRSLIKYEAVVSAFINFFGYNNVLSGNFLLTGAETYKKLGNYELYTLSRWARSKESVINNENSYFYVLRRSLEEYVGYDITEKTTKGMSIQGLR